MAVKIKLKRIGKIREPHYRIVVADARTKRNGRAIEELGQYHPLHDPSVIQVDSARVQYWLGVGAQPTDAVAAILRVTGDWQAFRGEPAPPPMKVAEPKVAKSLTYEAAVKEGAGEPAAAATTPKKKTAKAAAKPAEAPAEPTETPAEPAEAEAKPAEAAAEPVEAPAEPTEMAAEPTPEAAASDAEQS